MCFLSALDKSCCLSQLVHYQHKLQQLQQHVLQGTNLAAAEALAACPSLIKVRCRVDHKHRCITHYPSSPCVCFAQLSCCAGNPAE